MKKGVVILFSVLFLSLFLISFLAGAVSAAETSTSTWDIKSTFISTFTNLFSGNISSFQDFLKSLLVPEILFGILIFLVIFAVISKIPLFGQLWIKVTLAIIVSILAGGFIDIRVLQPILNQYTALGILISFYLPFILIFYFLKEVMPNNFLAARMVWFSYAALIALNAYFNKTQLTNYTTWLYWIVVFAAVAMAIAWNWIMRKLLVNDIEKALAESSETNKLLAANEIAALEETLRRLTGLPAAQRTHLEKAIREMRERLERSL